MPDAVLFSIAKQLVHLLAVGHRDITGDDFGSIFAHAIEGEHRKSPLGIADVIWNDCAWSVKTVKCTKPYSCKSARFISGRNSPDYSLGISDPRAAPEATGRAVLSIWNARVNEALNYYKDLRIVALIRNMQTREYCIFEEEALRFNPADYEWTFNSHDNLEGWNRSSDVKVHQFTWQPHGSQFTIIQNVPNSARQFAINVNVPVLQRDQILSAVGFDPNWITVY